MNEQTGTSHGCKRMVTSLWPGSRRSAAASSIGSVHEVVEAVDPGEVVRDVLAGCAEQIERACARVEVAEAFPRVACNHVHLFQILDNLIRNALKFVPAGRTPYIEIGLRDVGGNGSARLLRARSKTGCFSCEITESGCATDHDRIFEPFEQLRPE